MRLFVEEGVDPGFVNFKRLDARPLWSRAFVEKIFFSAGSCMSVDLFLFRSRVSSWRLTAVRDWRLSRGGTGASFERHLRDLWQEVSAEFFGALCFVSGVSVWFGERSAVCPELCLVDRRR